MASEGGKIPLIGLTVQELGNTLLNTAGAAAVDYAGTQLDNYVGQVFQGSGQSFLAGPGQAILSNSASTLFNVGLSAVLGEKIAGSFGVDLTAGENILGSILTPQITGSISELINTSIQDTLNSAGPFGQAFSGVATDLATGAFNSLLDSIGLGPETPALGAANAKVGDRNFPGGGGEPPADYAGGGAYTAGPVGGDVIFSLQPVNEGPQLFGLENLSYDPKSASLFGNLDLKQAADAIPSYANIDFSNYNADQFVKLGDMGFDPSITGSDISTVWSDTFTANEMFNQPEFIAVPPGSWTFICAPDEISWDVANQSNRVDMFGTNNPPVVAGTKGMIELSIGNALVEGFTRNVTVEGKIQQLQQLMNYTANTSDGFVGVPVYQFWANQKSYGATADGPGYFIIKDVRIKEEMRDLVGNATRSYVDISLTQVPAYQVNTGRDSASKTTNAARSPFVDQTQLNLLNATRASTAERAAALRSPGVAAQARQGNAAGGGPSKSPPAGGSTSPNPVIKKEPGAGDPIPPFTNP